MKKIVSLALLFALIGSCKNEGSKKQTATTTIPNIKSPKDLQQWILNETLKEYNRTEFGYDLKYIRQRKIPILLYDQKFKNMVLVSPEFQGRVISSSADGLRGYSFGWVNYDLIGSAEYQPHINTYGGEDRIWIGPEGGQFSLYFKPKAPFTFDNWQVPHAFDSEPFEIISVNSEEVSLFKQFDITNYSGTNLTIVLSRQIKLASPAAFLYKYGMVADEKIKSVGFQSKNIIRNNGKTEWNRQNGMPSIWILGMFKPSPTVTVVLPYIAGDETTRGAVVNDDYFGKIPADRMVIDPKVVYFKADGRQRGKIGLTTLRAKNIAGSLDEERNVLTIIEYTRGETNVDYVNSTWKIQDKPFNGDVVNAYNDGPLENGTQMGPFFELESSSKAANLKPNEILEHLHATYHFMGDDAALNEISMKVLGVSISEIKGAFK